MSFIYNLFAFRANRSSILRFSRIYPLMAALAFHLQASLIDPLPSAVFPRLRLFLANRKRILENRPVLFENANYLILP